MMPVTGTMVQSIAHPVGKEPVSDLPSAAAGADARVGATGTVCSSPDLSAWLLPVRGGGLARSCWRNTVGDRVPPCSTCSCCAVGMQCGGAPWCCCSRQKACNALGSCTLSCEPCVQLCPPCLLLTLPGTATGPACSGADSASPPRHQQRTLPFLACPVVCGKQSSAHQLSFPLPAL